MLLERQVSSPLPQAAPEESTGIFMPYHCRADHHARHGICSFLTRQLLQEDRREVQIRKLVSGSLRSLLARPIPEHFGSREESG